MSSNPDAEPLGGGAGAAGERAAAGAAGPPERAVEERYGPLLLARHRKGDGRALTLYGHAAGDREERRAEVAR